MSPTMQSGTFLPGAQRSWFREVSAVAVRMAPSPDVLPYDLAGPGLVRAHRVASPAEGSSSTDDYGDTPQVAAACVSASER